MVTQGHYLEGSIDSVTGCEHGDLSNRLLSAPRVLFVIGPPASGKTTVVTMLKNLVQAQNVQVDVIDEFDLLFHYAQNSSEAREISWNKRGSFTVHDRNQVFERTFDQLCERASKNLSHPGITICEIARQSYLPLVESIDNKGILAPARFLSISAPFPMRLVRNLRRGQLRPWTFVPSAAMTDYYATDDIEKLAHETDKLDILENASIVTAGLREEVYRYVDGGFGAHRTDDERHPVR